MSLLTINILSNSPSNLRYMLKINRPVFAGYPTVLNVNGNQDFSEFEDKDKYPDIIRVEHHDWITDERGASNIMANRLSYINQCTPYVMFLDDDVLYNACLDLTDLVKAFDDPNVGTIVTKADLFPPTRDREIPVWESQLLRTVNGDSPIKSTGQIYRTEDIMYMRDILIHYIGPAEDQLLARSPQYWCDRPTILRTQCSVGALHFAAGKCRCDEVAVIEPQLREMGVHFYRTSIGFHRIVAPWMCSKCGQKHPKNPRVNVYTPFEWSKNECCERWSRENPAPKCSVRGC